MTSFNNGSTGNMSQRSKHHRKGQTIEAPTATELREQGFDRLSVLHLNQRIMNGKIVVKQILTDTSFVIYHEDFRQEFLLKQIPENETLEKWIDLQTHTNLITAFDSFIEPESQLRFQMVENTNMGNMYQHIESLKLDLALEVPRPYLELIYDVGIQLATGLDFAHSSGLVHGNFDLSKVMLQKNDQHLEFKITDFAPTKILSQPLQQEANYWPFAKKKKQITEREKLEVLMLKDIYSLGICLLEMMIGRFSTKKFSISLESMPLTWAEFPESTPLIQVLVQCIQIDTISRRKGKLQNIKNLLINEYKTYFKRQFYKMESPFVGKKADVYNKKGIVSLYHKKGADNEALAYWQEADLINDRHFDSKYNYIMFRWSTAKISDEVLMTELQEFVFNTPNKGECLKAYLMIAQGQRDNGVTLLKSFIEEKQKEIKSTRIPSKKINKNLKIAKHFLGMVQSDKEIFQQNGKTKHNHVTKVNHLSFGIGGKGIVSTTVGETRIWKMNGQLIGIFCTIPANESYSEEQNPLSCVSSDLNRVIVHRGNLIFTAYDIDGGNFNKTHIIDLQKEIKANCNPGFNLIIGDKVTDLRFLDVESNLLRVYLTKAKEHYFIDLHISDCVPKMRKVKLFEDRSAFNIQAGEVSNYVDIQSTLQLLIQDEIKAGNVLQFPDTDMNTVAVLKKEDQEDKHFLIFDIKRNSYIRKISKQHMEDEAFAIDSSGRILALIDGDYIELRSIRLPNNSVLIDCLRPRFRVPDLKLNPADASQHKQAFKDQIYRDLRTYHMFQADPLKAAKSSGLTEEQNMHLMVQKYEEAIAHPAKMRANKEFLMMQKIILKDAQNTLDITGIDNLALCPIVGVVNTKRVEIYDEELSYPNKNSKIQFVQISSEPKSNFFLIAMDGIVYKYCLITKALLFQFKTEAKSAMILYDRDDKLCVANEKMIRLWDFYELKDEAPELITACESQLKPDFVFVNKKTANSDKNSFRDCYVLVTQENLYVLYKGRLDRVFEGKIDASNGFGKIMCCEFDGGNTIMWLGLSNGKMVTIDLKTGNEVGRAVNFSEEFGKPVTKMERFAGIFDQNYLLIVVDDEESFVWSQMRNDAKPVDYGDEGKDFIGGKICNANVAYNAKFFLMGIPEKRAIGFFQFDRQNFLTKAVKWLNKVSKEFFSSFSIRSKMSFVTTT